MLYDKHLKSPYTHNDTHISKHICVVSHNKTHNYTDTGIPYLLHLGSFFEVQSTEVKLHYCANFNIIIHLNNPQPPKYCAIVLHYSTYSFITPTYIHLAIIIKFSTLVPNCSLTICKHFCDHRIIHIGLW